jgi:hypothetical protein
MPNADRITRKYQVFISSTFKDLKECRSRALHEIVAAGHMATCIETWGMKNESQLDVIKRAVQDCQFYVLILGHCYGSCPDQRPDKSYVELELDYAESFFGTERNRRILCFMLNDDLVERRREKLSKATPDGKREIENKEKFKSFRRRLRTGDRWWRPFRDARDIGRDLFGFFRELHDDVPGYVRETEETADIIRISTSNQVIKEVVQRAGRFTTVEHRLSQSANEKNAIARAFCDLHSEHIRDGRFDKVFIESGSTLTVLAASLASFLPRIGAAKQSSTVPDGVPETKPIVATNNALAYLDLWLCNGVICRPEPESPPADDEKYGAMYGPLTNKSRDPDYGLPPIQEDDPESWQAISELKNLFLRGVSTPSRAIILAAASGIQLSDKLNAVKPRQTHDDSDVGVPYSSEPTLGRVKKCRGFHVGSYENKLLKRALYQTNLPMIVFIHDQKIDCPVEVGKCHFLFDVQMPWEHVVTDYPLSLWVGCRQATIPDTLTKLRHGLPDGWRFRVYGEGGDYPVVIAHNQPFRAAMLDAGVPVFQQLSYA